MRTPVPDLTIEPVPLMMPLNVLDNEPLVSVPLPSVTDPAPAIEPTVSRFPFKSSVPEMETALVSGTHPLVPSFNVPAVIVVDPRYVPTPETVIVPEPTFTKAPGVPEIPSSCMIPE